MTFKLPHCRAEGAATGLVRPKVLLSSLCVIDYRLDYLARKDPNAPGNLIVLTGEDHANRRRLWNRGMGSDALKEYDLIIQKRGEQLVEKLTERSGQALDMSAWFGYFT